ncbi:MAG: hypothetical protein GEV09_25775, partial [Pseudonocardiaceae bacterium]|nr:hypothetical protein [Pseudonocardiaceae bacterium]
MVGADRGDHGGDDRSGLSRQGAPHRGVEPCGLADRPRARSRAPVGVAAGARLAGDAQPHHPSSRRRVRRLRPCLRDGERRVQPARRGVLTGKHDPASPPAPGTRFTRPHYRDRYWNDRQFAAVAELAEVAAEAGLSLVELSYRWLLTQDLVDAVIVGASSAAQLQQ